MRAKCRGHVSDKSCDISVDRGVFVKRFYVLAFVLTGLVSNLHIRTNILQTAKHRW